MKKFFILGVPVFLFLAAILSPFFMTMAGCKRGDNLTGAILPLNVPTSTPTPTSGSIQVLVQDNGTAIQGVSVILVDPLGNTLGPVTTQPVVGYAAFNPGNVINGTWVAKVLTQGVSYVVPSGPTTIQHYYYLSSQSFPVNGPGPYVIGFSTSANSVSISPAPISFGSGFPINIPVTVTYVLSGNLNVPVSVICPILPSGFTASPSSFVMGEGVTQQAVTISKGVCYSKNIPFPVTVSDFVGTPLSINNNSPVTLVPSFSVTVAGIDYYYVDGSNTIQYLVMGLKPTNDCNDNWNYSVDSICGSGNVASGSLSAGQTVHINDSNSCDGHYFDNVRFTVWNGTVSLVGSQDLYYLGATENTAPATFAVSIY